jgi:hypothetical protein
MIDTMFGFYIVDFLVFKVHLPANYVRYVGFTPNDQSKLVDSIRSAHNTNFGNVSNLV